MSVDKVDKHYVSGLCQWIRLIKTVSSLCQWIRLIKTVSSQCQWIMLINTVLVVYVSGSG